MMKKNEDNLVSVVADLGLFVGKGATGATAAVAGFTKGIAKSKNNYVNRNPKSLVAKIDTRSFGENWNAAEDAGEKEFDSLVTSNSRNKNDIGVDTKKAKKAKAKKNKAKKAKSVKATATEAGPKVEAVKAESIEDTVLSFVEANRESLLSAAKEEGDAFAVVRDSLLKDGGLSSEQLQELVVLSSDEDRLNALGVKVFDCLQNIVDINDLSTDEDMYKTHKWAIEQAIAERNIDQLERFSKTESMIKYVDLAKLINDALPKEEEEVATETEVEQPTKQQILIQDLRKAGFSLSDIMAELNK
jgi:hypothetical protein